MVLKLDFFEKTSEQCYSNDNWRKRDGHNSISMRIENRSNNLNLFVNKQKYTEFKNTTSNYFVSLYWNEVSFWVNFDPKIHFLISKNVQIFIRWSFAISVRSLPMNFLRLCNMTCSIVRARRTAVRATWTVLDGLCSTNDRICPWITTL